MTLKIHGKYKISLEIVKCHDKKMVNRSNMMSTATGVNLLPYKWILFFAVAKFRDYLPNCWNFLAILTKRPCELFPSLGLRCL